MKYPEHEKQAKVLDDARVIGEFLENCVYKLGEWRQGRRRSMDAEFFPVNMSIKAILAEYFDIDLEIIETEKRQMLDELRSAQS